MKKFKDIILVKGVFTGHFQLSEYPVLGSWKIRVILTGKYDYSKFKTIRVEKYTLPRFRVYIKSPSSIRREDDILKVGIYARYTYDKYVEGYAIVKLWHANHLLQTKQIEIKNFGSVEFRLKSFNDFIHFKSLKIFAIFTENLTGIEVKTSHSIEVINEKYKIRIPSDEIEFRNNTPFRLKAYIVYWTGAPVLSHTVPVIMEHGSKTYKAYLNENAEAVFEFEYQAISDYRFKFADVQQVLPNILPSPNFHLIEGEYYCYLRILTKM